MTYDWQAELRQHLVRPNQDLSRGGQFSIRTGGTIILKRNSNQASLQGDAAHNIDLIEIFTLRSAIASGGVSITNKSNGQYNFDPSFGYYTAAICDFHNIPHNFTPPRMRSLRVKYQDAWERVVGYLEEKYAEQPKPVLNISKKTRTKSELSKALSWPVAIVFYLFVAIWIGSAIMGHGKQAFLILAALFIAFLLLLTLLVNFAGMTASLDLPKRLARFVLLTLGTKAPPPATGAEPPPDPPQQPPPPSTSPGPPPSGTPPLPDGLWLGGLDEEPPPAPMAPAGPPPSGAPPAVTRQPPAQRPAAAEPPEPPLLPVTPMARMDERQAAILCEITEVAHLLDSAFNIPLINKSIGLDPLLGTVWGLGDAVSFLPATYIILRSATLGLPSYKLVRMFKNTLIDTGIGLIPIAGQAADFFIKANIANLNIIHEHFGLPRYKRPR